MDWLGLEILVVAKNPVTGKELAFVLKKNQLTEVGLELANELATLVNGPDSHPPAA